MAAVTIGEHKEAANLFCISALEVLTKNDAAETACHRNIA